jgi:hypothetical protein
VTSGVMSKVTSWGNVKGDVKKQQLLSTQPT